MAEKTHESPRQPLYDCLWDSCVFSGIWVYSQMYWSLRLYSPPNCFVSAILSLSWSVLPLIFNIVSMLPVLMMVCSIIGVIYVFFIMRIFLFVFVNYSVTSRLLYIYLHASHDVHVATVHRLDFATVHVVDDVSIERVVHILDGSLFRAGSKH